MTKKKKKIKDWIILRNSRRKVRENYDKQRKKPIKNERT